MPGGRPRKPRNTKIIQGTFRKDRNPGREPTPPIMPIIPKPPPGMNRWARRLWKDLVQDLVDQQLLSSVDLAALQLTCEAYGDYEESKQAIFRPLDPRTGRRTRRSLEQYLSGIDPWMDIEKLSPLNLIGLRRNSQTAPELTQRNRAWRMFKAYMIEFGLSPASRNRINLPTSKEPGQDPMEKILNEA